LKYFSSRTHVRFVYVLNYYLLTYYVYYQRFR